MVAVTSISPKHRNNDIQAIAVKSWIDFGLTVYSFNEPKECEELKPKYPDVIFVPTMRTMQWVFSKPYVSISAIFDYFKYKKSDILLINSDIVIKTDINLIQIEEKLKDCLILANRINHNGDYKGVKYLQGIDAFFIPYRLLFLYPETLFCLGQCHFDYMIPYQAIRDGYDVYFLENDFIYHLEHPVQYSRDNWMKTGEHFKWIYNLVQFGNNIGQMSTYVFKYIYNASQRLKL